MCLDVRLAGKSACLTGPIASRKNILPFQNEPPKPPIPSLPRSSRGGFGGSGGRVSAFCESTHELELALEFLVAFAHPQMRSRAVNCSTACPTHHSRPRKIFSPSRKHHQNHRNHRNPQYPVSGWQPEPLVSFLAAPLRPSPFSRLDIRPAPFTFRHAHTADDTYSPGSL